MPPLERHLFVCEHRRDSTNPKGCCASKGSLEIRARLKKLTFKAGLRGQTRVNSSGCLDHCELGVSIVVYPEAIWYGQVTLDDVDEIFEEHILHGRPVQRLIVEGPGKLAAAQKPQE